MKKSLLAGMLGISMVMASYGQGMIHFSNYFSDSSPAYGINGQTAGPGNPGMGPTWTAQLLYYIGDTSDSSLLTPLNFTSGGNTSVVPFGFGVATGDGDIGSGWFDGGFVQIPGINPANASVVTFQFLISNNGIPTYYSTLFQSAVSPDSGSGAPNFVPGSWQTAPLVLVPEPSTFALVGLGSAALMIFRRRK